MPNPFVLRVTVFGALYLTAVFLASVWGGHGLATRLVITAMGVTYLSDFLGVMVWQNPGRLRRLHEALVVLSIVFGFLAGLALLV